MMRCSRCGLETPRLTVDQRHCPRCRGEVDRLIAADARRREPRFRAKDMTGTGMPL
jgi:hypothetical protein